MHLFKKRLKPELGKNSEYLTREYKSQINNTKLSYKIEKENDDYLKFIGEWYKKNNINDIDKNKDTDDSELEIEYIYSQKKMNPLTKFQEFLLHDNKNKKITCDYAETTGDIFSLNTDIAIGQCVSKCFTMTEGIMSQFKTGFNNKDKLINQHKNITEVAHLKLNDQWILYLITKNDHNEKSTYLNIFKTLENTKQFCTENKITTLALPKICTDSDKKQWDIIANMIQFIFQNSITKIRIYSLPERENDQKSYTSNTNYNIISNSNFNDTLKNEITLIAGSFVKLKEVPRDGDCGAHALRVCLQNHNINKTTIEILNMLTIQNLKSGYYLKDDDLAFICDQFKINLFIIYEINENTNAIVYWKPNRQNIGIFHRKNHWTPGISVEIDSPLIFKNITINTIFPDLNIIKGNIDNYLNEYPNTLQLSNQNFVENKNKNNDDTITNMECRQRVLSIKVEYEGNEKYAILDTGSNLSCIDYSLTKNKQLMEPKGNIIITGADNTELKQLGRIEITIKIKNYHYLINAYVIEGLHCKLLLGNDFNIKNNVIIDFKNRKIQITNNTIPMNEIWYDYNKNNITRIHTKINYITSIIYNEKGKNNIENKNITTPHEQKFNYKSTYTDTNKNEKENKANQTNDLKLETQIKKKK